MNKKMGLFLCIMVTTNHIYSQESLSATEPEQSSELFDTENFHSDQDHVTLDDKEPSEDDKEHSDRQNEADHEEGHTPGQLQEIANDEANKDLVGLLDTLETGAKKTDVSFDNSHENKNANPTESIEEPALEGIDTVDLDQPQGNWLFKRIWWERAEARYEKIKKKIEEIFENRMIFFEKKSELEKNILDPFYLKIGMGQGELQAILTDRIQTLEKERDKKGSLSPQERDILAMLEKERETLDQLMADVQAIDDIDSRFDEALSLLLDQMKTIRAYDMQAWQAFKEIARVVDDEKARQLYYTVETSWRNVKDIGDYLSNSFTAHFDELVSTARAQTERISQTLAALKEKGIDFKKQVEQLIEPKPVEKKEQTKEDLDDQESEEEQGLVSQYIINPALAAWNGIVSVVTWPYYALFGSQEEELEQED